MYSSSGMGSYQGLRKWSPSMATSGPMLAQSTRLVLFLLLVAQAGASPVRRDSKTANKIEIWVPIVVIVVVIVLLMFFALSKKSLRQGLAQISHGTAIASGVSLPHDTMRELTADQLAGTTPAANGNGNAAPAGGNANTQGRGTRRARRNRRTPSQRSTASLPVYAKEPGDQELVIFRGTADLEDANPTATTVIMPAVSEDDAEGPFPSVDESRVTVADANDTSTQQLMPARTPGANESRASLDTGSSETTSLLPDTQRPPPALLPPPPTDAAPPYFEFVEGDGDSPVLLPLSAPAVLAAPDEAEESVPPVPNVHRRSGFLGQLFTRHHNNAGPTHARSSSSTSDTAGGTALASAPPPRPSTASAASDGSRIRARGGTHRPSGSGPSNSIFRPLSRQRSSTTLASAHALSSPSLISINSISAPLTHTAVRTEITYPRAGPTPEQVRLLSSRESVARFGKPYGADAIAYAAGTSRVSLAGAADGPPPGFDVPSEPRPRSASGAARARGGHSAQSSLSLNEVEAVPQVPTFVQGHNRDRSSSSLGVPHGSPRPGSAGNPSPLSSHTRSASEPDAAPGPTLARRPVEAESDDSTGQESSVEVEESSGEGDTKDAKDVEETKDGQVVDVQARRPDSVILQAAPKTVQQPQPPHEEVQSMPTNHASTPTTSPDVNPAAPAEPLQSQPSPSDTQSSSPSPLGAPTSRARSSSPAPPPSSFKPAAPPASATLRSRASSVSSWATAAESITSGGNAANGASDAEFTTPHASAPGTPRLVAAHVQEETEATITPLSVGAQAVAV